jgi:hypothetical protein
VFTIFTPTFVEKAMQGCNLQTKQTGGEEIHPLFFCLFLPQIDKTYLIFQLIEKIN